MTTIKSLCLYCGSSGRVAEVYREAAAGLGRLLAECGIRLIYGGGHVGLMGIAADAALNGGGEVIGVIPRFLKEAEAGYGAVTQLFVVDSMHARKQKMFQMADAFAVLPGGLGTLDETIEVITWKQLGLHDKPIVIVDVAGFWAPLQALIGHIIAADFARPEAADLFTVVDRIEDVLPVLARKPEAAAGAELGRL